MYTRTERDTHRASSLHYFFRWQNFLIICVDIGEFQQAIFSMHTLLTMKEKEVDIQVFFPLLLKAEFVHLQFLKVLKALVQVVLKNIPDRYGEPGKQLIVVFMESYCNIGVKLQKPVTELLGRITSQISTNPEIWEIYANFHGTLGNKEKVPIFEWRLQHMTYVWIIQEIDCLTKMVRYTETAGWERDLVSFEKVSKATVLLVESYMSTNDSKNILLSSSITVFCHLKSY
jgi:hypothetical protein